MKKGFDIHNYQKRLEQSLLKLEKRSDVTDENKKTILSFVNFCEMDGMSVPRRERYLGILSHWSIYLNMPFKDVTKEDVINAVAKLQKSKYKEWTKSTYKSMLKRFYKWLLGEDEEYPACVKWVNTKLNKTEIEKIKNDELLTEKEVISMIAKAQHPRDKALISVLYESGCRIGEIGSLQLCNVHIDDHGARLEDIICAGLLHDALEDTDYSRELLIQDFGQKVYDLVDFCSEPGNTKDHSAPWKERKEHSIKQLKDGTKEELLVFVADKLANVLSMNEDLICEESLWERFNAPRQEIKWYYESILHEAKSTIGSTRLCRIFEERIQEVFEDKR